MAKSEQEKAQDKRDILILLGVTEIYDIIRLKVRDLSSQVHNKAKDQTDYFTKYDRKNRFAKKVNKELRPEYVKRDTFSKNRYTQEYTTAYFHAKFGVENQGIRDGYKFRLPRYTRQQLERALNNPLSKLMDSAQMQTSRSVDIQQLYTTIVSGIDQGSSLPNINRQLDIDLGYRDAQGKWIADKELRRGQQYKTRRILRTEISRIRNQANTDQWINQQDIVPSNLQLVETLDNRTRSQSARMDGQFANKEGKFKFPNGQFSFVGQSGVAKWDINDRATTINVDPEYPPESRIERDPKTGKNKIVPYKNFETYAKDNNLKRNIYGQVLFPNNK